MDYSLPAFSVHEISQARILEWVAISLIQGYNKHFLLGKHFIYYWVTGEVLPDGTVLKNKD